MHQICLKHGIEISEPKKSRGYSYASQEYGEHQDRIKALNAELERLTAERDEAVAEFEKGSKKRVKKIRKERDEAVQERDKLKTQLSEMSSELAAYKKAEEERGLFTREKLKKQATRISREDELSRELRKAKAFISVCGLSDDFARYKFTKTRGSELE